MYVDYHKLTPWSRVIPEKLTGPQLVQKCCAFLESVGSLLHSEEPLTSSYHEPVAYHIINQYLKMYNNKDSDI